MLVIRLIDHFPSWPAVCAPTYCTASLAACSSTSVSPCAVRVPWFSSAVVSAALRASYVAVAAAAAFSLFREDNSLCLSLLGCRSYRLELSLKALRLVPECEGSVHHALQPAEHGDDLLPVAAANLSARLFLSFVCIFSPFFIFRSCFFSSFVLPSNFRVLRCSCFLLYPSLSSASLPPPSCPFLLFSPVSFFLLLASRHSFRLCLSNTPSSLIVCAVCSRIDHGPRVPTIPGRTAPGFRRSQLAFTKCEATSSARRVT